MSQVFDREYLQNLAGLRKREQLNEIMKYYEEFVRKEAIDGKTSYLASIQHVPRKNVARYAGEQPLPPATTEELVEAFKKKYPGCGVSYKEEWVDSDSSTRVLKKGVVIDWS